MLTPDQARFVSGYRQPQQPAVPVPAAPVAVQADPGRQVSAAALDDLGVAHLKGQQREVLDIVVAAVRNGARDMTGKEIQARYRALNSGKDIDAGTVSARVNSLIAAKLLERSERRACFVTGLMVGPVRPVAQQARLAA